MTLKIEIKDEIVGELGEAIQHEDHPFTSESYHFDSGAVLDVASYDMESENYHIFTDLDSGHRFKIHPDQYKVVG